MGDVGGGGDVAVGESESRGAFDGLVVVDVGFAFAFGGALDFAEDVGAQLGAGAVFADAFGFGDGAEGGAWRGRVAGGVNDAVGVLVGGGGVVAAVGAEAVGGGWAMASSSGDKGWSVWWRFGISRSPLDGDEGHDAWRPGQQPHGIGWRVWFNKRRRPRGARDTASVGAGRWAQLSPLPRRPTLRVSHWLGHPGHHL